MTTSLDDAPAIINLQQFCRQRRRATAIAAQLVEVPEAWNRLDQADALNHRLRQVTHLPQPRDANLPGDRATDASRVDNRPIRCRTACVEADLEHIVTELEAEVDRLLRPWDGLGHRRGS